MRMSLIEDLLYHFWRRDGIRIDECDESAAERLKALSLPSQLFGLLRWTWVKADAEIGRYTIIPVEGILSFSPFLERSLKESMIPIGYALNGDPLVLRWSDKDRCEVGLISHEEFDEDERVCPTLPYARVTSTLEEYLLRAVEGKYLPIDYYAARELDSLRQEMSRGGTPEISNA